jgi:hypothetical protein
LQWSQSVQNWLVDSWRKYASLLWISSICLGWQEVFGVRISLRCLVQIWMSDNTVQNFWKKVDPLC